MLTYIVGPIPITPRAIAPESTSSVRSIRVKFLGTLSAYNVKNHAGTSLKGTKWRYVEVQGSSQKLGSYFGTPKY